MTDEAKERFLADRVRALAAVRLTRRDDLTTGETRQGTGLDLHVYIDRKDKPMRLAFGVLLRGVASPTTADGGRREQGPGPDDGPVSGDAEIHVPRLSVLLHDAGRGGLLLVARRAGADRRPPKLVHHGKADCVELTDDLLGQVVERIVGWYDAVEGVLIA
jgi:hypothetical protein